ncbi:MAG: hypothetical protein WA208_20345, partial [Thermoanaerobaculia bacterium]
MLLLMQEKAAGVLPRLDGAEVLVGPNPAVCAVKGVMFGGRKQFLTDTGGPAAVDAVAARVSPRTAGNLRTPLASSWYEFSSIVELDRAIHDEMSPKMPNVLVMMGAASAALGIGRIYRSLDTEELVAFLESNARFHDQYQKFGKVRFERTADGGRMIFSDYPCYSPIYCASAFGYFLESILRHGGTSP